MAEPLSSAAEHGRNSTPEPSQAISLTYHTEHDEIDAEAASLRRRRKELRNRIKQAGIQLRGFDRARRDRDRPAVEREAEDAEYRRQMAWMSKPIGFQPSLDINEAIDEGQRALNVHELHRIDNDGFEAGRAGHKRQVNPWSIGTEAYQRWDTAWIRGQAAIAATLNGSTDAAGNGASAPRRRGRPRKNQSSQTA